MAELSRAVCVTISRSQPWQFKIAWNNRMCEASISVKSSPMTEPQTQFWPATGYSSRSHAEIPNWPSTSHGLIVMNHGGPKLLEDLKRAWHNENFAPLLLPYQGALVDAAKRLVKHQERFGLSGVEERNRDIAQKEVDRFVYILRSYLRKRLHKVGIFIV